MATRRRYAHEAPIPQSSLVKGGNDSERQGHAQQLHRGSGVEHAGNPPKPAPPGPCNRSCRLGRFCPAYFLSQLWSLMICSSAALPSESAGMMLKLDQVIADIAQVSDLIFLRRELVRPEVAGGRPSIERPFPRPSGRCRRLSHKPAIRPGAAFRARGWPGSASWAACSRSMAAICWRLAIVASVVR